MSAHLLSLIDARAEEAAWPQIITTWTSNTITLRSAQRSFPEHFYHLLHNYFGNLATSSAHSHRLAYTYPQQSEAMAYTAVVTGESPSSFCV